MKSFDLEKAKAGEPLVTRDGRKARFIGHAPECNHAHRVLASVEGTNYPLHYEESGRQWNMATDCLDLFMAPKKRTWWIAVHPDHGNSFRVCGYFWKTKELAESSLSCTEGSVIIPVELED